MFPEAPRFMRRIILSAIALLAVIAWSVPAYGDNAQVTMRVALSAKPPFEFLLEQDALVFPLLEGESTDDKEVLGGREAVDNEPYTTLRGSRDAFLIRSGNLPEEVVLCYPSGETVSFFGGLRIVPVERSSRAFQLGGRRYPGELQVSSMNSRTGSCEIAAVNLVDLETYTEGVLAGEVYRTWQPEALKAQAVAARTYALRRKIENESRGFGFDVDDTVLSQVYVGENRVDVFRSAVVETRGQVLVYDGIPIKAHYFSSGGGITEGDEEVWLGGNDEPYLTGREDFDYISPYYRWEKPFVIKGEDLFRKLGLRSGSSVWIEPSIRSGDKILAYRFRQGNQGVNLTREQIRHTIGLNSPRFHITVINDGEKEKKVVDREQLKPTTLVRFDGAGKGHGVGLSQWGAQGMALMVDSSGVPLYTYVDILNHYYPGALLVNNYNLPEEPAEHGEPMGEDHIEPEHEGDEEYIAPMYESDEEHMEPAHETDEGHIEPVYENLREKLHWIDIELVLAI